MCHVIVTDEDNCKIKISCYYRVMSVFAKQRSKCVMSDKPMLWNLMESVDNRKKCRVALRMVHEEALSGYEDCVFETLFSQKMQKKPNLCTLYCTNSLKLGHQKKCLDDTKTNKCAVCLSV